MKLSATEIDWVRERMDGYVIKYQEIYDEVLDHIITAIEERRQAGDDSEIDAIFQNVLDNHFNGYTGIKALADDEEKLYHKKISKLFYTRLKQQFNWKTFLLAIVLLVVAYKLPNIRLVNKIFFAAIFLMAFSPIVMVFVSLLGKIETAKGKKSLIKKYLIAQTFIPMMLFNAVIYLPVMVATFSGQEDGFTSLKHLPPVIMMAVLVFFMLVNSSYIQSSRYLIAQKLNRNY